MFFGEGPVFFRARSNLFLVFAGYGSPVCYSIGLARKAGLPVIRFHDCRHTAATLMLSHGIPPVIVAGMLGHSISILLTTYAHFIPTMQDEAAQLMNDILVPIPIDLNLQS